MVPISQFLKRGGKNVVKSVNPWPFNSICFPLINSILLKLNPSTQYHYSTSSKFRFRTFFFFFLTFTSAINRIFLRLVKKFWWETFGQNLTLTNDLHLFKSLSDTFISSRSLILNSERHALSPNSKGIYFHCSSHATSLPSSHNVWHNFRTYVSK